MASTADMTKTELADSLVRARSTLKSIRENSKQGAKRGLRVAMMGGAGLAAGAINAKMPLIPKTKFPTNAALGLTGAFLGTLGVFDDASDDINAAAGAFLAVEAAKAAEQALKKPAAK